MVQNIDYENLEKSADREKELNVQLEKMSEYYCEAEK